MGNHVLMGTFSRHNSPNCFVMSSNQSVRHDTILLNTSLLTCSCIPNHIPALMLLHHPPLCFHGVFLEVQKGVSQISHSGLSPETLAGGAKGRNRWCAYAAGGIHACWCGVGDRTSVKKHSDTHTQHTHTQHMHTTHTNETYTYIAHTTHTCTAYTRNTHTHTTQTQHTHTHDKHTHNAHTQTTHTQHTPKHTHRHATHTRTRNPHTTHTHTQYTHNTHPHKARTQHTQTHQAHTSGPHNAQKGHKVQGIMDRGGTHTKNREECGVFEGERRRMGKSHGFLNRELGGTDTVEWKGRYKLPTPTLIPSYYILLPLTITLTCQQNVITAYPPLCSHLYICESHPQSFTFGPKRPDYKESLTSRPKRPDSEEFFNFRPKRPDSKEVGSTGPKNNSTLFPFLQPMLVAAVPYHPQPARAVGHLGGVVFAVLNGTRGTGGRWNATASVGGTRWQFSELVNGSVLKWKVV